MMRKVEEVDLSRERSNGKTPVFLSVAVEQGCVIAKISDGRVVMTPLSWLPSLEDASQSTLLECKISLCGSYVSWPKINTGIHIGYYI